MILTGIILTLIFAVFYLIVRKKLRSGYVFIVMLACMVAPSLLNMRDMMEYWCGTYPIRYSNIALFGVLLCCGFIPWVMFDAVFRRGLQLEFKPKYVETVRWMLTALIALSLYSILYFIPFVAESIMRGAYETRTYIRGNDMLPRSIFTTLATTAAACNIYCIPAYLLVPLSKRLKPLRWWLFAASWSYPLNCLVYMGRDAFVIYAIFFAAFYITFYSSYSHRVRKAMNRFMIVGAVLCVVLAGALTIGRFSGKERFVGLSGGSIGYISQQPYVFNATVENDDLHEGWSRRFPLVDKLAGRNTKVMELTQRHQWMFGTMYADFYRVGGWKTLVGISALLTGWFALAMWWLRRRRNLTGMLLLFAAYLYIFGTGLFYFRAGYSVLSNVFWILASVAPLFVKDVLQKRREEEREKRRERRERKRKREKREKEKRKILFINTTAATGSTGSITCSLAEAVSGEGWNVEIAYSRGASAEFRRHVRSQGISLYRIGSYADMLLHGAATRFFDAHGLASCFATRRLIRHIRSYHPDIIHLHNIHGYYINYPILFGFLRKSGIKVVWTLHDVWPLTGHCSHFQPYGCEKWIEGCRGKCPAKRRYPAAWLYTRVRRNFRLRKKSFADMPNLTVVGVSKWISDVAEKSLLHLNDIVTIHNGIDLDVFNPRAAREDDEKLPEEIKSIPKNKKIVLTSAGNWGNCKGLKDFCYICSQLSDSWQGVVLGQTPLQANQLADFKNITSVRFTHNPYILASVYARATVFVNASRADTFPTVNIEALACATPVACYATGGSPEALDPESGMVVEYGNADALVHAVEVLGARDRRRHCRKRAEECFDRKIMIEKYIRLYNKLTE